MADVPKDLLQEINRLEELFTVDTAKLKSITDHFVSELIKGILPSWLRLICTKEL
jgi:hexokinase